MISYCISIYNEKDEIVRLLTLLRQAKTQQEEIVVLQTYKNESEQKSESYQQIKSEILSIDVDRYDEFHFHNKFSSMKNYLNNMATKSYIFNLDADELLLYSAFEQYRQIIAQNQDIDLYYIPRINTVNGLTSQDIASWSWRINEFGWVNWPDYQPRLYKNNSSISWVGDVHEHIHGFNKPAYIPQEPSLALIHAKDITKQRLQNALYDRIQKGQTNE